ncbi:MAG: hypothetical protein Q9220_006050 [cf. Caloplaca sp. 1 TL-2023]
MQGLPNEVLSEILTYTLTSPYPILNAWLDHDNDRWPNKKHFLDPEEPDGRRDINVAILSTCRFFYQIGTPILYERNKFLYAANIRERYSRIILRFFRRFPLNMRSKITNLVIRTRYIPVNKVTIPDHAFETASFVIGFPSLRTLQIDFYHMHEPQSEKSEKPIIGVRHYTTYYQEALGESLTKPIRLQQLTMTGLPYNNELPITAVLWSRFVDTEGTIGLGYGIEGRRYYRHPERIIKKSYRKPGDWITVPTPKIRYRKKRDMVGWVLEEGDRDGLVIPPFEHDKELQSGEVRTQMGCPPTRKKRKTKVQQ